MRPSQIFAIIDLGVIGIASVPVVGEAPLGVTYAFVAVAVMWASGAYRQRIHYRVSTELPALLGQMTVSALAVSVWPGSQHLTLLEYLPLTMSVVVLARISTYGLLRGLRARPGRSDDALIIGADGRGEMVAEALLRHRGCGITPIGFVDRHQTRPDSLLPTVVMSDLGCLHHILERVSVKHLIFSDPADAEAAVGAGLWHWQARDIEVWVVPRLFGRGTDQYGRAADSLSAIPFDRLRRPGHHTGARLVKRAFDLAVAVSMMVLAAPVLAVLAAAVRLTSPGPIFFRQRRIGQNGSEFELVKFRTMMVNSDSDTMWSVRNDRRMTPIGRFLRRSSLDELPQVFNVIRGDMSLVGPRPERPYFHDRFSETVTDYSDRLRAPVGNTGWAQIHGLRGDTSIAERTRFDNFYIEHWSPWLDVVILVRTLSALLQWMIHTEAVPSAGGAGSAGSETRTEPPVRAPVPVSIGLNATGNQS